MLDPHFKAMLEAQEAATPPGTPPLEALPVDVLRGVYRDMRTGQNVNTSPAEVTTRDFTVPGPGGPIPVRLYTPPTAITPGPLLVYFHGGGWVIGDLETHDAHCRRLALYSDARIWPWTTAWRPSIRSRPATTTPWPPPRWAFDHAAGIGVDPARIGVGGDQAGGNLAASVAHRHAWRCRRGG